MRFEYNRVEVNRQFDCAVWMVEFYQRRQTPQSVNIVCQDHPKKKSVLPHCSSKTAGPSEHLPRAFDLDRIIPSFKSGELRKERKQHFSYIMNDGDDIVYVDYTDESMLADIQALVSKDLSEPYSIFTYRYFLHNWPKLCICAYTKSASGEPDEMIGTIICKAETEGENFLKGYIAMLAVSTSQRKKGIGLKVFLRLEYTPRCMLYHFLSCHTIFTSIFFHFQFTCTSLFMDRWHVWGSIV